MKKKISLCDAVALVKDGMTIMVGGFLSAGGPKDIMDALAQSNVKDLTLICNDTTFPDKTHGQLFKNGQIKRVICSYIGANPYSIEQMNSGELEVEFSPQGTLAERIRAKGAGLGGVLTPTGLGTLVAQNKEILTIDGKDFIVEKPIGADIAFIGASISDEIGNLVYKGTTQNYNPMMATAADIVVVEAQCIVPKGAIPPEQVHTPAIFVDYIYFKE